MGKKRKIRKEKINVFWSEFTGHDHKAQPRKLSHQGMNDDSQHSHTLRVNPSYIYTLCSETVIGKNNRKQKTVFSWKNFKTSFPVVFPPLYIWTSNCLFTFKLGPWIVEAACWQCLLFLSWIPCTLCRHFSKLWLCSSWKVCFFHKKGCLREVLQEWI